jgi:hypothetical protein
MGLFLVESALLTLLMLAFILAAVCFAGQVEAAFGNADETLLRRLYAEAPTRSDSLLALFRLIPLTGDASLLEGLPSKLEASSPARELAWLSALWGFRAQQAGLLRKPTYGAASIRLIEAAERVDRDDPWVLLISGQSYLYRPSILGGSSETALARFERLVQELTAAPECGLPVLEARIWVWMGLSKGGRPDADSLRAALLATDPPPRYRTWLEQGP